MNELALFAGSGGGILGTYLLGWRTVCAVEIDPYCRRNLIARQRDGILPHFPIWDDIKSFDGRPWREHVDVVTGGFPCQDISVAGKGAGIDGPKSGLWSEMARIIGEVRPIYAFVENSPALVNRGLGRVIGDLSSLGYDARWGIVSAADAIWLDGDPCIDHKRERIFILASRDAEGFRCGSRRQRRFAISSSGGGIRFGEVWENTCADSNGTGCPRSRQAQPERREHATESVGILRTLSDANGKRLEDWGQAGAKAVEDETIRGMAFAKPKRRSDSWWATEPDMGRMAHGVADRVDRLRAIGNGQVPAVVRLAWETLINY